MEGKAPSFKEEEVNCFYVALKELKYTDIVLWLCRG